jgi:uncharacterized membrane protein YbhN (UPF0104 family)
MSHFWKRIISLSIISVFILWSVLFILDRQEYFAAILQIRWQILILLILLIALGHILNGILLMLLVSAFNVRLGLIEAGGISIISSFINYIAPFRGGIGFRVLYLKRRRGLTLERFAAVFGGTYILNFYVMALIAMAAFGYLYLVSGITATSLLLFFLGLSCVLTYIVFYAPVFQEHSNRFFAKVLRILNSWDRIRKNRKLVIKFALVTTIQLLLIGIILYVSFSVSGISVYYPQAMLIAFVGRMGMLLGITPGSVGIVEGMFLVISPLLGIGREEMLVAAFIRRGADILTILIASPVMWFWLNRIKA